MAAGGGQKSSCDTLKQVGTRCERTSNQACGELGTVGWGSGRGDHAGLCTGTEDPSLAQDEHWEKDE